MESKNMSPWKSFTEFTIKNPLDYEISDEKKEEVYALLNARAEKIFTEILSGPEPRSVIATTQKHKCGCRGLWHTCNMA